MSHIGAHTLSFGAVMSPVPPKLESYTGLKVHSVGGDENWLSFDKTKLYTNAYVISEGKVCSACMKPNAY